MEQPVLLIEPDRVPHAVTLTLNRPAKRNALHLPLLHALREAVISAPGRFPHARALVLRGAGPAFCAGMDLAETGADPHVTAEGVRDVLLALARCPLPTVALVQGAAVAGGLGLVAACDFAVLASDARVGLPEVRRGLVAALVSVFLRRQLPERHLRELLLGGELLPADRALAMGLANRVVSAGALEGAGAETVFNVVSGAPGALATTKRLLLDLFPRSLEEDCRLAMSAHEAVRGSDEACEGAAAFLQKRSPSWTALQNPKSAIQNPQSS